MGRAHLLCFIPNVLIWRAAHACEIGQAGRLWHPQSYTSFLAKQLAESDFVSEKKQAGWGSITRAWVKLCLLLCSTCSDKGGAYCDAENPMGRRFKMSGYAGLRADQCRLSAS